MRSYLSCAALSFALLTFASWPTAIGNELSRDSGGHVSNEHLIEMGLGSLKVISDTQGHQIRGQFVADGVAGNGFFITDVHPNAMLHNKNSEGMPGRVVHHSHLSKSAVILYHPKFGVKYTGRAK